MEPTNSIRLLVCAGLHHQAVAAALTIAELGGVETCEILIATPRFEPPEQPLEMVLETHPVRLPENISPTEFAERPPRRGGQKQNRWKFK